MTRPLLALLLLATSGCASSRLERAPGFDPRAPLRVAVLPFVDRASGVLLRLDLRSAQLPFRVMRRLARVEPR